MDSGVGVDYLKVFPHIHTEDLVVDGLIVPVSQVIVSRGKSQNTNQLNAVRVLIVKRVWLRGADPGVIPSVARGFRGKSLRILELKGQLELVLRCTCI